MCRLIRLRFFVGTWNLIAFITINILGLAFAAVPTRCSGPLTPQCFDNRTYARSSYQMMTEYEDDNYEQIPLNHPITHKYRCTTARAVSNLGSITLSESTPRRRFSCAEDLEV